MSEKRGETRAMANHDAARVIAPCKDTQVVTLPKVPVFLLKCFDIEASKEHRSRIGQILFLMEEYVKERVPGYGGGR